MNINDKIFSWWEKNKRILPWRIIDPSSNNNITPYHILVSEFILQQTQVNRVIPKYLQFIEQFPTIEELSKSKKEDVLKLWIGLGYNRRAIWLREAAMEINRNGYFPRKPEELIKFKGIGKYCSHSIPIFAFNDDLVTIDINVRRVLIEEGLASIQTKEKKLYEIAEDILPPGKSRNWHSALMDYGSTIQLTKRMQLKKKKASTFKGSNREKRGKILKILKNSQSTINQVIDLLNIDKSELLIILSKMEKEGLLEIKNNTISL